TDDATVTITVSLPAIDAVDDAVTGINGFTGSASVLNVLGNDTYSGAAATLSNTLLSVITPASNTNVALDPA
ncbi:hypothetical protein, partial [Metamycoplasma hominis]|uniref:hypothetical protein n=1 Tax=Metamycoplasma hominis TaxID=2098 RepID=UPI001CC38B2D